MVKSALSTTDSVLEDIEYVKSKDDVKDVDFLAMPVGKADHLQNKIEFMQQKDEVKVKQTLEVPAFIQNDLAIYADSGVHLFEDLIYEGTENEKTPEQIVPSKNIRHGLCNIGNCGS